MKNQHNEPEKFPLSHAEKVFETPIFSVQKQTATALRSSAEELEVYTLKCSHWVNIVPVTSDGHVVLIRQHRFGSNSIVCEVPGGAVDRNERDFTMAALRELEEETGYTTQRVLGLPSFLPNPALQGNSIGYFIALDVTLSERGTHLDPFENIAVQLLPWQEAIEWVRQGKIQHALSALAILLAEPVLRKKFS